MSADSPTNFMVETRATMLPGPDGILGTADDIHEQQNTTTPFVDQNQTYSSIRRTRCSCAPTSWAPTASRMRPAS